MRAILLSALLALAGCNNNFDPINYVSTLRLLDVKATPAEVPGGAATSMTAIWANPNGPTPTILWDACLVPPPPGSGSGINLDCVAPDMGGPGNAAIGSGETVNFTMPVRTLAQLGLPDASNGFYLPIRVRLSDGTQNVTAIFRLRYYPGAQAPNPPNQNPTIMGLFRVPYFDAGASDETEVLAGTPPDVHAGDKIDLRALLTPDSLENYVVITLNADGTIGHKTNTETVSVDWFATAGTFSPSTTGQPRPNTTWTLDKHVPAPGSTIDLWLVAADERGGSDTLHRTFTVR
jgi:uncharacterized lipoprotein NlpE involved in copper resistance